MSCHVFQQQTHATGVAGDLLWGVTLLWREYHRKLLSPARDWNTGELECWECKTCGNDRYAVSKMCFQILLQPSARSQSCSHYSTFPLDATDQKPQLWKLRDYLPNNGARLPSAGRSGVMHSPRLRHSGLNIGLHPIDNCNPANYSNAHEMHRYRYKTIKRPWRNNATRPTRKPEGIKQ